MRKIQITVVQLDNYGPWTVTPEPKPEPELQVLQAEIYSYLQREFFKLKGMVFQSRQDNLIAVTNGIGTEKHREILERFCKNFPVTASMGIGTGLTAYEAQVNATLAVQGVGSSRSPERRRVVAGEPLRQSEEGWVEIVHADINHSTLFTDAKPIYDTHFLIQQTHLALAEQFLRRNGLAFYMGGDNFMIVANGIRDEELIQIFGEIKRQLGIELKAGIGEAPNAVDAANMASRALQDIRLGKSSSLILRRSA